MTDVLGIHHVTAIASDPQRNLDFYAGLLGLRLVKRTVNFDDPQTPELVARCESMIEEAVRYTREHLEDMPDIRDWTWSER